jgi:hypothetical protein
MEQTAVEKMIQYFIEQKDNGASHWCINDLIAQLYQAKAMEKEQIIDALQEFSDITLPDEVCEKYYNETFKSE